MRKRLFLAVALLAIVGLWGNSLYAFDIPYPGEEGFYIGVPMVYVITADSDGDENIGQEGVFTFGQDQIAIDGAEYYDCVFESLTGVSHFYFGIDSDKSDLTQKGFKLGETELNLDPAITAVHYPLSPGDNWSETTDLTAENLEIPDLGVFPIPILIADVIVETEVSAMSIIVPAGTFDTLLVEATYTGSLFGIPLSLAQRTWLTEDNITVKRSFEFSEPTQLLLYDIELSKLLPTSVSRLGKIVATWGSVRAKYYGNSDEEI